MGVWKMPFWEVPSGVLCAEMVIVVVVRCVCEGREAQAKRVRAWLRALVLAACGSPTSGRLAGSARADGFAGLRPIASYYLGQILIWERGDVTLSHTNRDRENFVRARTFLTSDFYLLNKGARCARARACMCYTVLTTVLQTRDGNDNRNSRTGGDVPLGRVRQVREDDVGGE